MKNDHEELEKKRDEAKAEQEDKRHQLRDLKALNRSVLNFLMDIMHFFLTGYVVLSS